MQTIFFELIHFYGLYLQPVSITSNMSNLIKTDGIVLDHVRYRDTSAIIHIYTRELGRQNYIVNRVRGNRKSKKSVLLQPLNRISMEVYHSTKKDLHRIKEFSLLTPLKTIPFSQSRRAQAFFLTELFSHILNLQEKSEELFDFLKSSIDLLDSDVEGRENLHLFIMFRLTQYLGFYPRANHIGQNAWFDIKNGHFVSSEPLHPLFLNPDKSALISRMFDADVFSLKNIALNSHERRIILHSLLDYYNVHAHGFSPLKSLEILEEVLHS
ncbi:DNA repair protein RecO [Thermophagus xiamenensis]|uniref:DNA repair protein RecO n=1 Tax=Thermophagus xiamenensis TaxID=385682 RepID=A0A1I2EQB3_9BACT|nr:DNA repair protein RecO [Thermophagus xiamenensis]SFE94410.1 DNA replication and repair protein RecO [Thermophagus xiamenensis]